MSSESPEETELKAAPGAVDITAPAYMKKLGYVEEFLVVSYAASLPLSLTLSWALFLAGMVVSSVSFILEKNINRGNESKWQLPPLLIPLLIMALAVTISGAFNGASVPGRLGTAFFSEALASLYSLKTLLPYLWANWVFQRYKSCAISSVTLLLCISAISGVWGSVQQIFDIHPGKFKYLQGTGFLSHPMAFAGQMQIFSMLSLALLLGGAYKDLSTQSNTHKSLKPLFSIVEKPAVFALVTAANLSGLFFAGERSAWLGGVAGVLSIALLRSFGLGLKALGLMSALSLLSWMTIPLLRTRIESIFSGHDVSISARQKIWTECLICFQKSPLFGIGWLKFPHFDIAEAIVPGVSKDLNHGHSNYMHILTTTGLLGLLSYLFLLAATLKSALVKTKSSASSFDRSIAAGIFGAAISLAIAGVFEFNFGTAQVRMAQWFVFALL